MVTNRNTYIVLRICTIKYYYVRILKMVKRGNAKLTVSVDEKVVKEFKKICDEEGWKIGKQIEKYMKGVLMQR